MQHPDATSSSSTAGASGTSSSEPGKSESASGSSRQDAGNTTPSADNAPPSDVPSSEEAKADTPSTRESGGPAEKKTEAEPKSAESARGSSSASSARPQVRVRS